MTYYSFRELVGSKIYDSEGLYYGNVCGYELKERVELKACIELSIGDRIPNVEALKNKLRSMGFDIPEDISLEDLVLAARSERVEIPYVEVERRVELSKGYVDLNDVSVIDVIYRRGSELDWRVAVVILKEPREAIYRGYPLPYSSPYVEAIHKAVNKLVVSLSEGIIGYVEDIVFAPSSVGLRVDSNNYRRGAIMWNSFITLLKARGYEEHSKLLLERVGARDRIDIGYYGYVFDLMRKSKAPAEAYSLLNSSVEFEEEVVERYRDISWNSVLKLGDVVIAK